MSLLFFALGNYFLGSLSFAIIISKLLHLPDPRSFGSGNPGATNMLRGGKKIAALLTLIGDISKGYLAIFIGQLWQGDDITLAIAALAVMCGHLWPIFFRFRGGKGVATAAGVLLGIHPVLGLATLLVWLITFGWSRLVSLASLIAALSAPIIYWWLHRHLLWGAIVLMTLLLIGRHKNNIVALIRGIEKPVA